MPKEIMMFLKNNPQPIKKPNINPKPKHKPVTTFPCKSHFCSLWGNQAKNLIREPGKIQLQGDVHMMRTGPASYLEPGGQGSTFKAVFNSFGFIINVWEPKLSLWSIIIVKSQAWSPYEIPCSSKALKIRWKLFWIIIRKTSKLGFWSASGYLSPNTTALVSPSALKSCLERTRKSCSEMDSSAQIPKLEFYTRKAPEPLHSPADVWSTGMRDQDWKPQR